MDKDTKIATRQSFGEALKELGEKNEEIVVLDADLAGATKTDLLVSDVPENEVFPIEEFAEFRVRLINGDRIGAIVNFVEWIKDRESDKNYGKRI